MRISEQGKQSRDDDTNNKKERLQNKQAKLWFNPQPSRVTGCTPCFSSFRMLLCLSLCTSCHQFNCCQCTKFIHCTGIPCRDSHCENGLVRCCLYRLGVKASKFHAGRDFAATRSCSPRPRCFSCICRFDMARGLSL